MEKMYQVELQVNIFKETAIYGLQEILLDNFLRNFYIWKSEDRSLNKISSLKQIFSADIISGSRDFTQDLTFVVLILINSADGFVLVMACEIACARAAKNPF